MTRPVAFFVSLLALMVVLAIIGGGVWFAWTHIQFVAACTIGGAILKASVDTARRHGIAQSFRAEVERNPVLWRLVALSACAAFGVALPDIISFVENTL